MSALVKSSIRPITHEEHAFTRNACDICGGMRIGAAKPFVYIDDSTAQRMCVACLDPMLFADRILHQTAGLRRPVQGEQFPANS